MASNKQNILRKALQSLGVSGHVSVLYRYGQARINVDGKYFGIYNFERGCFVD
jgi:hypothetical protein